MFKECLKVKQEHLSRLNDSTLAPIADELIANRVKIQLIN